MLSPSKPGTQLWGHLWFSSPFCSLQQERMESWSQFLLLLTSWELRQPGDLPCCKDFAPQHGQLMADALVHITALQGMGRKGNHSKISYYFKRLCSKWRWIHFVSFKENNILIDVHSHKTLCVLWHYQYKTSHLDIITVLYMIPNIKDSLTIMVVKHNRGFII